MVQCPIWVRSPLHYVGESLKKKQEKNATLLPSKNVQFFTDNIVRKVSLTGQICPRFGI